MNELAEKKCSACEGKQPVLGPEAIGNLKKELQHEWQVRDGHLEREFKLKDFREALDLTNRVGELAENEGHHPDIYLAWGKVKLTLWTHSAGGLTENDFVLAAKIDRELGSR